MSPNIRLAWLPLLVSLGCNGSSAFTCEDDVACEGVGPLARCEANGYCSYDDPECDGGRRYGELAGDALGGQCVGEEALTDGTVSVGTTSDSGPTSGPSTLDDSTLDGSDTQTVDTTGGPDPVDWWDCGWQERREIVIDVPSIGETLADVPVLVVLDSSRIDPSIMAPDGHDLRFIAEDGATVLSQDIEQWSPGGLSWAWIHVPELHEGQNHLFMYYGNPAAPALDSGAVWADYAAVWHMSSEVPDATGQHEVVQAVAETTPGQAALAQRFGGDTDGVEVLPPAELGGLFVTGGTITAMIRATSWGGNGEGFMVSRAESSNGDGGWIFGLDGNRAALRFARGFDVNRNNWISPDDTLALHTWHHVAVVYQDDAAAVPALYIDGLPQRLSDMGNPMGNPSPDDVIPTIYVAGSLNGTGPWFDGIIDELRLAQQPRSAGWITVQAASLRDELVSFGPPGSSPCGG